MNEDKGLEGRPAVHGGGVVLGAVRPGGNDPAGHGEDQERGSDEKCASRTGPRSARMMKAAGRHGIPQSFFWHGFNLAAHAGNIKPVFVLLHLPCGLPGGAIHAEVLTMSAYPSPAFEAKICAPDELAARVAGLPRPVVFTNGCFDILHRGHVTYLAQARALGAALVVALNTDESVRRLGKGGDRPINTLRTPALHDGLGGQDSSRVAPPPVHAGRRPAVQSR